MTNLTPNFTLEELTHTDTGLPNAPTPLFQSRLISLAQFMEKVRALCGNRAISVHSAFRSFAVNRAVGGVPNSSHAQGFACDFTVAGQTPYQTALLIDAAAHRGEIIFDQLILEQLPVLTWAHIARRYANEGDAPRMERFTKNASGVYLTGLRERE
jgi:hypothetical protein